jgi:DNA-directed RNA polymerase III subunit RPC7
MSFRGGGQRQLLPFGLDWADIQQNATETYEFPIPINGNPTNIESESYQQFINLTNLMKDSSFYTGNLKSLNQENLQNNGQKKKNIVYLEGGVNDGLKRYSDKYRKQIKIGRSINDHPFILRFFPDELHSVISSKSTKKSLNVSKYKKVSKSGTNMDKFIKNAEERQKEIMQRLNEVEANNMDDDVDDVENQEEEENFDDEFEDDDDDDYNAEKYFDDGDDFDEHDDGDDEAAF